MQVKINHSDAERILRKAVNDVKSNYKPKSSFTEEIKTIILGPHKTYRYIFVNALLAKATENSANPLVLQSGSKLKGAFDARSLCHKVLVKIERDIMDNSLGGSNEPFLNKPARYKELSITNPVRRGKDSELLKLCIEILTSLKNSAQAFSALKDAIRYSFLRNPARKLKVGNNLDGTEILKINIFISKLTSDSCGGESCVIVSAIAFELLGISKNIDLEIRTHPVNQTGDSSKEISDIDVFYDKNLIYTAEVKDKNYTIDDLDHAAQKIFKNDFDRLLFLKGPNAKLIGQNKEEEIIKKWADQEVDIFLSNVLDFFTTQLYFSQEISLKKIIKMVNKYSQIARVSDKFVSHAKVCVGSL